MSKALYVQTILILAFGTFCGNASGQPLGLVHSQSYSSDGLGWSKLKYLEEDSVFVYQLYNATASQTQSNYGLWEDEFYQPQFNPIDNISFFLDKDWNLMGAYENSMNTITFVLDWYRYRDSIALATSRQADEYFNGGNYPVLGDNQSFGYSFMQFRYHTTEQWFEPHLFFDQGPGIFPDLLQGCHRQAMGLFEQYNETMIGRGVSVNDSVAILVVPMRSTGDMNLETYFSIGEENVGYVFTKYNYNSGEYTAEVVYSEGDVVGHHGVEESRDDNAYYAIKTIYGEDPVYDMSGEVLPNATDTAYTAVLTRENIAGNAEWVNTLYEYNNSLHEDEFNNGCMSTQSNKGNALEIGNTLFYNDYLMLGIQEPSDTIYYRDFMGEVYTFNLTDDLIFTSIVNYKYLMAKSRVFAMDRESGDKYGMIEVDGNVTKYRYIDNFDGMFQNPALFDVGDSLAWVTDYKTYSDTTIQFNIKLMDGSSTAHQINLPAGYSSVVLWLDNQLNVLDEWVFSGSFDIDAGSLGIQISEIAPFGQDSIILAATFSNETNIDMGISGVPQLEYYPFRTTFLGIYGPTNSVGLREMKDKLKFSVYPNPASDQLQISLSQRSETTTYSMFDISGRQVQSGLLSNTSQVESISVSDLMPGIYLLKVQSGDIQGVKKVVVE